MCDCYEDKCKGCGKSVRIHIGDFSTGRNNVRVWCPACHAKLLECLATTGRSQDAYIMFYDQGYIFLCDYPRSIHVN